MPRAPKPLVPAPSIQRHIYVIRGHKVMLDADLATLYQVSTRTFNQAVKRNSARFPADFMFQLSEKETENLRSQSVTSSWGGRRYRPYAFTEHGVAMLSAVLRSGRAVETSVMIVRAFIALREMIAANKDLAARVEKLESSHRQTASIIDVLVDEIENVAHDVREMKTLPPPSKRKIGFGL